MFCSVRKTKGKDVDIEEIRYRFYLSERTRVNGKVKSSDKLVITLDFIDMTEVKPRVVKHFMETMLIEKGIEDPGEDKLNMMFDKYLSIHKELKEKVEAHKEAERERIREEQRKKAEEESRFREKYFGGYENYQGCSGIGSVNVDDTTKEYIKKIIKEGYRRMSHKVHPDRGGSTEEMQLLNKAKESLDKLIG